MQAMDKDATKEAELRNYLHMAFGLTITRANGSDYYTNPRVAAYAKFMETQEKSRAACRVSQTTLSSRAWS